MIVSADAWGPFARDIDEPERRARLRSLRQTARLLAGPRATELCRRLAAAETDPASLEPALAALNRLEPSDFRRVVGSYAGLVRPAA